MEYVLFAVEAVFVAFIIGVFVFYFHLRRQSKRKKEQG